MRFSGQRLVAGSGVAGCQHTTLAVGVWNINGRAGTWSEAMRTEVGKWDVIILTETHLTETQSQQQQPWMLRTHEWFQQVRAAHRDGRQRRVGQAHGGVAVGVRRELMAAKMVQRLEVDRDDVVWLRIDGATFGLEKPLLITSAYIPPAGSVHHNMAEAGEEDGAFDMLTREVLTLAAGGYVLVGGDLNARIGDETE